MTSKRPLVITEDQYHANQATFSEFDQSVSGQCVGAVGTTSLALTRLRPSVTEALKLQAKNAQTNPGADVVPMAAVWGPLVADEPESRGAAKNVTQYYKLVPAGTEEQHATTDGSTMGNDCSGSVRSPGAPPPLPRTEQASNGSAVKTAIIGTTESRFSDFTKPSLGTGKLYRVSEVTEVTTEDIQAELAKPKRKKARAPIYIRGTIVEPRLRVEL